MRAKTAAATVVEKFEKNLCTKPIYIIYIHLSTARTNDTLQILIR